VSHINKWISTTCKAWAVLLLSISLSACGSTVSWKEQVLLHNGHTIVVTRTMDLAGADGEGYRKPLSETLTFIPPGSSSQVIWKTSFNDSSRKQNSLNPILLGIVRGDAYIVTMPAGCISYNKWHRPNPPYVAFVYQSGHWVRIPIKALPPVLIHTNLIDPPSPDRVKSFYTLKDVQGELHQATVKDAMTVFRTPIPTEFMRCPVLVPITSGPFKGGWKTPGAFPSIKSLGSPHH